MESQHALRSLSSNEYHASTSGGIGSNNTGNLSVVSRCSHSPVTPPSTLTKGSVVSSESNTLSHTTFIPNIHFNSPSSLHLDSWLAAAAASTSPSALLSSGSLNSFLSHPSSLYPTYLLHSTQSGAETTPLLPHPICNSSIGNMSMISGSMTRVNSNSTSISLSPAASPLNLSVNGSTIDSKQMHSRASLTTNRICNETNKIKSIEDNLCKEITVPHFDHRSSSIVALRLRAKEHVELINQSLTIA